jgi:hypothetical protein
MTIAEREQTTDRALDYVNVAYWALIAAKRDLRKIGNDKATEAANALLEHVGRLSELADV